MPGACGRSVWSSSMVISSNGSAAARTASTWSRSMVFVHEPTSRVGDRVAGEVGQRAGLGHEPVDTDDQADTVEQVGAVRLQAAGQRGQSGAGDTGGALGSHDHEDQQADLLGRR